MKFILLLIFVGICFFGWKLFQQTSSNSFIKYDSSDFFTGDHLLVAEAIRNNDNAQIKKLFKMSPNIDINMFGKDGMTLLLWAIGSNNVAATEKLLQNGANPNLSNEKTGETPITFVVTAHNTKFFDLLLKYKANPDTRMLNGEPLTIFLAIHMDDEQEAWDRIQLLLKYGANIDATDKEGNTLIMIYAGLNNFERVASLIDMGANIKHQNIYGATLLDRVNRSTPNQGTPNYAWKSKVIEKLRASNNY